MGLFDKLKDILFDEETVEIPVITKEEKPAKKEVHEEPKRKEENIVTQKAMETMPKREERKNNSDDEVKITKVAGDDVDLMPKLKEEAKEEVKQNTFTFPVFSDDDIDVSTSRKAKNTPKKEEKRSTNIYDEIRAKNNYANRKFESMAKKEEPKKEDYSRFSSYKSKDEPKSEEKHFQLSPIISPVYGILNEDYTKEDIVTKTERKTSSYEKLDFEEVRKKAYGTLEDTIEESLDAPVEPEAKAKPEDKSDVLDEVPSSHDLLLDDLPEDGLSVSDLLVDKSEEFKGTIDREEDLDKKKEEKKNNNKETRVEQNKDKHNEPSKDKKGENEALGEDDLFDLIDSLYAGKGEN